MTSSTSAAVVPDPDEGSFSHVLNRDLYKHRDKIVGMKANSYMTNTIIMRTKYEYSHK